MRNFILAVYYIFIIVVFGMSVQYSDQLQYLYLFLLARSVIVILH